jgi:hypothetical protein
MLTLTDLIDNGTVTPDGADVLRGIGANLQSFLTYALPRNAGKSTVANAVLAEAPSDAERIDFLGTAEEVSALAEGRRRGYLVVAEMGHRGRPGYLAGEEIPRAFDVVEMGYSLATSLHADTVAQAFDVLAQNGVPVSRALTVRYMVKVCALGDPFDAATRRIVEEIHETAGVDDAGQPATNLLYRAAPPG